MSVQVGRSTGLYKLQPQLPAPSKHNPNGTTNRKVGSDDVQPATLPPLCLIDRRNLLFRICELALAALIIVLYQVGALGSLGAAVAFEKRGEKDAGVDDASGEGALATQFQY